MTYKKDNDLSYLDMSLYVDKEIYTENPDVETVYKYLYLIIYMLSKNSHMFLHNDDYDKFALYMASKIYFRLTNKDQYRYNEDGSPKLDRVKNVMNYIKQTIGVYKIRYQKEEFAQNITHEEYELDVNYSFDNVLQTYVDKLNFCEFKLTFNNIDKTCKQFLKTIPYKQNTVEWLNIYTSVMMTLLKRLTPTTEHYEKIKSLNNRLKCETYHIADIYDELATQKPVLYHLPQHMSNYIDVLSRQLKHIIAKDLSDIYHTNISMDVNLYNNNFEGVEETYEDY